MNTDLEPYQGGTPEPYERLTHDEMVKVGQALHQSGWFKDITDPGKAVVKIMLGQEMGVSPMTAVRGIFVIPSSRGPVITLSGDLVAKLMKAHGYTWNIDALDEQGCRLTIFSGPRKLGQVEFTQAMARKAGLLGKDGPWKQFTEDMFFNRAICRAQRRYAPEVTGGLPMPVVEAEELDASYPDPRDDLVKALHATYREVYPQRGPWSEDEYRQERLDWSERVLGRAVASWNGPDGPETLTRAEFQELLTTATSEAEGALSDRLRQAFGDDEVAGLNFLRRALPGVPFDVLSDLDGKQRKAVHKALDVLESTPTGGYKEARGVAPAQTDTKPEQVIRQARGHESTPALTRGQAAPSSSPDAASAAGADHTQGHTIVESPAWVPALDPEGSAGEEAPLSGSAPGSHEKSAAPAEHHTEPSGGQAATRVGTGSEAGEGSPKPSGGASAPTRKRRPTDLTGAPGVKEAMAQAQQFRNERKAQTEVERPPATRLQELPPEIVYNLMTFFQQAGANAEKVAESVVKIQARRLGVVEGAEWTPEQLTQLAAATWDRSAQ